MALYLIGDLQGCLDPLERMLARVDFSASRDTLYLLGDLVNRGPDSLGVLRRLHGLGDSARCLLGNHDLHLLAAAQGLRAPHRSDTLTPVLEAPDRAPLLEWLRRQHMALHERVQGHDILMVHAGVLPSWTLASTLSRAAEVEQVLRGPGLHHFLAHMYGNSPDRWDDELRGPERLRVIVNTLTRLRFCNAQDRMEFDSKEGAGAAPAGFQPWFEIATRQTRALTVAFGHWSTLGWIGQPGLLSLDTGCVWGGCLTAVRLTHGANSGTLPFERIQVPCPQAQKPGA